MKIKINKEKIEDVLKPKIKIKHPGAFTEWCSKNNFNEVNCSCIKKGLLDKNVSIRKMANFARNFGHPECK